MRYLHNYKGTTLPLWADRVKNWLLSFPLAFFPPSLHPGGWCTTTLGGDTSRATRRRHPALWKPITIQRAEPCRSNRRSSGFLQPGIHLAGITFCRIWTNTAQARARTRGLGQNAAGGTLGDINLHSAEDVWSREIERRPMMALASGRTSWKHDVELCSCRRSGGGIDIWNGCKFALGSIHHRGWRERLVGEAIGREAEEWGGDLRGK